MKKSIITVAFIFFQLLSSHANAIMYKWVDEDGVTHYSNYGIPEKHMNNASEVVELKYPSQPVYEKHPPAAAEKDISVSQQPVVIYNAVPTAPPTTKAKADDDINTKAKLERARLNGILDNGNWDARKAARKDLENLDKNPAQYFFNKDEDKKRHAEDASNAAISAQGQINQLQNQLRQQEIQMQSNQIHNHMNRNW